MLILCGMVMSAMTINLYVNTADNNKVDKTANLTLIRSASGTPVEPFSLLSPVFTIEHTEGDMSCNYQGSGEVLFCKGRQAQRRQTQTHMHSRCSQLLGEWYKR